MSAVVELHTVEFSQEPTLNDARALPIDEQARAKRFVTPESRSRFVTMRLILRSLLSQKLGRDISGVSFHYTESGKPFLPNAQWHFNISHSESRGLIALSTHGAVGIDLEAIHPLPELQALAKRYFSATEQTTLAEVSGTEETERFYQIWTRKEALVKGLGLSFAEVSNKLNVWGNAANLSPKVPKPYRQSNGADWFLQDITNLDGFSAALASTIPTKSIDWHHAF